MMAVADRSGDPGGLFGLLGEQRAQAAAKQFADTRGPDRVADDCWHVAVQAHLPGRGKGLGHVALQLLERHTACHRLQAL